MASKTAYFYKIAKRKNSTLIPTSGTAVEVDLKAGTDLISPSFLIQMDTEPDYNLMKYEGRYYFINRITSIREKLWNIECEEDYLATWKSNVLNTRAYVLYHTHENTELSDKRLGINSSLTINTETAVFPIFSKATNTNNAVILTIISDDTMGIYAVDQETAKTLLSNLNSFTDAWGSAPENVESVIQSENIFWTYLAKVSVATYHALVNLVSSGKVADCITNCYILPIALEDIAGESKNLKLGKYQTDESGKEVINRIFTDRVNIDIPWQTEDWRRNLPYTELYLYLPYVGLVQISNSDLLGATSLTIQVTIDIYSGDSVFIVRNGNQIIGQYNTNVASPYAIGTSNVMSSEAITTMVQSAGGITDFMTGNGASGATSAILGACNILSGSPSCIGSNSGGAALGLSHNMYCVSVFHDTVAEPETVSATIGTPTNKVMSLSSVRGYVQTSGASVSGTMLDVEREALNNLLNGGIYIE